MSDATSSTGAFQLPAEVTELCDVAHKIVRQELLPLEPKFLPHPGHAFGLKETLALQAVFGDETLARLTRIARDTGFWYLAVPEKFGGPGLSMLARIAIMEQFNYTAVPFPFANVPNILYECKGDQVERFLTPVIEGEKTTCFAQTEPNAGSDPGGMMQTRAVKRGDKWVLNGTKMWISMAAESDIIMVQAVTDPDKRQKGGITMFLVERNNPGVHVRSFPSAGVNRGCRGRQVPRCR